MSGWEVEAKLLAPRESDLRAIARVECLGPYRLRRRDTARLHSIYVDTADLTLARHGVALRLRRHAGRWEATAKWAGQVNGVVHERRELTRALRSVPRMPFSLPPGVLRTQLNAQVAGQPLTPILITTIQRRRFDVLRADAARRARPVAELALDQVRLHPPGQRAPGITYCEVEIELLHGTRRDIANLARLLRQDFGLTPSRASKFARGLALIYGPDRRLKRRGRARGAPSRLLRSRA